MKYKLLLPFVAPVANKWDSKWFQSITTDEYDKF